VSLSDDSPAALAESSSIKAPPAISTKLTPAIGPLPVLPVWGSVDGVGSVVVVEFGIEVGRIDVVVLDGVVVDDVEDVGTVVSASVVGGTGHVQTITLSKATYLRPVATPTPEI